MKKRIKLTRSICPKCQISMIRSSNAFCYRCEGRLKDDFIEIAKLGIELEIEMRELSAKNNVHPYSSGYLSSDFLCGSIIAR